MKNILIALALTVLPLSAMADHGDEGLKHRIDQDSVNYVDSNMMWANNCEFKLNQAVARPNVETDGVIAKDDEWNSILSTLCDHNMGFSKM